MYSTCGENRKRGNKTIGNEMTHNWLYFIINRQYFTLLVVDKIVVFLMICGLLDFMNSVRLLTQRVLVKIKVYGHKNTHSK